MVALLVIRSGSPQPEPEISQHSVCHTRLRRLEVHGARREDLGAARRFVVGHLSCLVGAEDLPQIGDYTSTRGRLLSQSRRSRRRN